eukprot:5146446-Pyramimonas_sp.AAC.1
MPCASLLVVCFAVCNLHATSAMRSAEDYAELDRAETGFQVGSNKCSSVQVSAIALNRTRREKWANKMTVKKTNMRGS